MDRQPVVPHRDVTHLVRVVVPAADAMFAMFAMFTAVPPQKTSTALRNRVSGRALPSLSSLSSLGGAGGRGCFRLDLAQPDAVDYLFHAEGTSLVFEIRSVE